MHIAGKSLKRLSARRRRGGFYKRIHTGNRGTGHFFQKSLHQTISKGDFPLSLFFHPGKGLLGSCSKTDNPGNIFRSGTQSPLLRSATEERRQLHSFTNIEQSYSLWPMNLMAACGKKVYPRVLYRKRNLSESLHCITVKQSTVFLCDSPDCGKPLDGPDLIVRRHHGNKAKFFSCAFHTFLQCLFQRFQRQKSFSVHRNPPYLRTKTLDEGTTLQHRMMFNRICKDLQLGLRGKKHPGNCPIIAFRAASGKVNLTRRYP